MHTHTHTHTQCAFLTWCMLPMANNGSVIIYHRLIKPFVKKHEKDFDAAFSQVGDIAKDVGKHGKVCFCIV